MDEFRLDQPIGRRALLKGAGALGLAGLTAPWAGALNAIGSTKSGMPIKHVIVDMQENRSFDHYYGFAPFAGSYGPPPGYSQPDGQNGFVSPYHFTSLSTPDIGHGWNATHGEWDSGKMDGFYTTDGINCLGYYTAADLPFYYSLFKTSTLCANYFCSLLGPTWPNRFYLASGTSGGITTNGIWGFGVFDYPIILDLLEAAGVTWKVYNIGWTACPSGTPTTSSSSGSAGRTMNGRAGARAAISMTSPSAACRKSHSSFRASRAAGTSILRPISRWAWGSRRS